MRILTSCRDCDPSLNLVVQTDDDQVPTDPELWADLVENLTGDIVPESHDDTHRLAHEYAIGEGEGVFVPVQP